ncbi:hypothetical protein RclHR1_21130005 [Rhizophagus clarus]|uniref:Uncharacterized protein n=1 Tax=Rhizophagus clarus TaxID=94130 RepID=A0A2Z6QSM1_9GLOM|nr:hypothetical protein RclHR1_21130005 [Rhizophagus clarus]GES82679.1 hypothetical protein GLOIN_2v1868526 [Rhizophagus clarus]
MLRLRMRCDAPPFPPTDYNFIMQHRDDRPRSKVLNELKEKYNTLQNRIYQIWRGEEKNRVAWDQPIYMSIVGPEGTASFSSTNVIDKQNGTYSFQNKYNSTILALENIGHDAGVEPSKSTNPVLKEDVILGNKAKKAGGKKPKSKSVGISKPSITQNQLTPQK